MIKAVILDVDGILIGEKVGFNSPEPHKKVVERLKEIRSKGVPIILCTAKPYYAITDIINNAYLNDPHITDGGAVIIDPLDNAIISKLLLEKSLVREITQKLLDNNVYTELYTLDNYYVQKNQTAPITKTHELILQKKPVLTDSLIEESSNQEITKIMSIAENEIDKKRVSEILKTFEEQASINWGLHPVALPHQFVFIVNKQTSKKDAAQKAIESLGISFNDVLGAGDTTSDWKFISLCGYAATLENGSEEIQQLVTTKGEGKFSIGKSIDENGILDVFDYFKL